MSVLLIDPRAVHVEEAAPKFDLPPRVAPAVPGRADEPLEPTGGAYMGAGSTQLASALQRRYPGLKIKALYTGQTLEHAVAYDPKTGLAHDARGTHRTASSAFDSFGSHGARGSTRVENPPGPQDGDSEADAYVVRHWGARENGGGSAPPGFEPDADVTPGEYDDMLGGDMDQPALDEGRVLAEAIWNEHTHPRWPKGTPGLGGKFMRVGQRFNKDGHEWEISHIAGNRVIAIEASGNIDQAQTRVFDTKSHVEGVPNVLPNAVPAAPRKITSGGQYEAAEMATSPIQDASTGSAGPHDPSIPLNPNSTLTPEEWAKFGRVDQIYYNALMDRYGPWQTASGKKPASLSSKSYPWEGKLDKVYADANAEFGSTDATSIVKKAFSSQYGSSSGTTLSLTNVFNSISSSDSVALKKAQERYAKAREVQGEVNSLVAWDLYNRMRAPDVTTIHRSTDKEFWGKILQGKKAVMSGLSTAWGTGVFEHKKNSLVAAMPIRAITLATDLFGKAVSQIGHVQMGSEKEFSIADQLKLDSEMAVFYTQAQVKDHASGGVYNYLKDKLSGGQSGDLAKQVAAHMDPNNSYDLPLPPAAADFQLKKKLGEKTYVIPPADFMAKVEMAMDHDPGHVDMTEQKTVTELNVKPGDVIEKNTPGLRYLVIQNEALGAGTVQYIPLAQGAGGDYDVNPPNGWTGTKAKIVLTKDGKPMHFDLPPPPKERVSDYNPEAFAPAGPKMKVSQMEIGDKVAINNDHWEITNKTATSATITSLTTGDTATVNTQWPTQKLEPTGIGAGPKFEPEPGKPALITATNQLVTVENIEGDTALVTFGDMQPKTVALSVLTAAPTLPKLTPQKGDTFGFDGTKMTVTNVLKNGTVRAKGPANSAWPHVIPFEPGHAALDSLFRPNDYVAGAKKKLHSMEPGSLVLVKGAPYQVQGTLGGKTHLKNLYTGEISKLSMNVSYSPLNVKGTPEASIPHPHDSWKPGDKVQTDELHTGDSFSFDPGGEPLTVTGEATHQGELGWQIETSDGTDSWIPKNWSSVGGLSVSYVGKGEPTKAPPVTVTPGEMMDAVEHGDLAPYKWHKGGGGQVYPKLNTLPDETHFFDKNKKLWKVKQSGQGPVVTDGHQLYKAEGIEHVKVAEPGTYTPIKDVTPEVSPPLPKPEVTEQPLLDANNDNLSLSSLNLAKGDYFTYGGQTWQVDTLASGGTGNLSAHSLDMAAVKAFHGFAVPDSYSKAGVPEAPAGVTHPVLTPVGTHGGVPVKAYPNSFTANELAQRSDGSIVYLNKNDEWIEVGGGPVTMYNDEELTPLNLSSNVPSAAAVTQTTDYQDIHSIPTGQTFFAHGDPFLMLGHGPAGADAVNLDTKVVLSAPIGQKGDFALGSWSVRGPSAPTVPPDSPLSSMLADYEQGVPGQYGAWSIKKTEGDGTALYFHDMPVAFKAAEGDHYVSDHPGETWPGSTAPQEVISQLQTDHPAYKAVPQSVLNAVPLAPGQPGEVPHATVQTGAHVPGPGIANVMDLQKGHQIKLKTDGTGAEYEVLATPKPGDKTIQVHHLKSGKVYTPKIWPSKQVMVTKSPSAPAAPASEVPHMVPNWDSIGSMKVGGYFGEGGSTYQIENVTKDNVVAKNLTTGITTTLHKGFVPEKAPPAPEEPTEPPSAPIPTKPLGTMADLNVGDKYDYGPGTGYEVTAKGPDTITIKDTANGFGAEHTLALNTPFTSQPTITYKSPPPAGANAAGHLGGPPTAAELPITPYLWHKSGTKTYPALGDLKPGEQFTDKAGVKGTVYKHNVKHLEDPVATTSVQMPDGSMVDVPQQFVNAKGKLQKTHVNKLSTVVPSPTAQPDQAKDAAHYTANEFLIGAGHTPADIQKLHAEAEANVASGKYPAGWSPTTKWAQAYADAYVDTYGEDASTIDMGNGLFDAVKKTPTLQAPQFTGQQSTALQGFMSSSKVTAGPWHTEIVGPPQHATMVLYHGPLAVAYSDENGKIHVTPVTYKPEINAVVQQIKTLEPDHIVADGQTNLDAEILAVAKPKEPKSWADLRLGDIVKTGDTQGHPFKVIGQQGSNWEIESQHDGSKTLIPKASALPITLVGHEHIDTLPPALNDQHAKAMEIADKWMKGQNMDPSQIAQIHKAVADFHGSSNQPFPLGDSYATAIGDKKSLGGWQVSSPWGENGLAQTINTAVAPQETKPGDMVGPHEMDVGDTFEGGGQIWQATGKTDDGGTEYSTLGGAYVGVLNPSGKFELVAKGSPLPVAPPPTAEASEIPLPQNDTHKQAVEAADTWLLNVVPTSKTANWIHVRAAENKKTYPGWTWGEAYAAASGEAMPDLTTEQKTDLRDHIDGLPEHNAPTTDTAKLPQPATGPAATVPDYTDIPLTLTGGAGGTTGAQFAKDPQGNKWLVKGYGGNEDRVATELLANAVYRTMGLKAAEAGESFGQGNAIRLAYPLVDGKTAQWSGKDEAKMKALGNGVMTDALVGNWDFAGLEDDNVLWNGDEPTRIDQGGTFMYRAQGKPKPFGPVPLEVNSLLTGGGQGVKGVSVSEASLRQQAGEIADTLTPQKIDQLVDSVPFKADPGTGKSAMREQIRENLKARVTWMAQFANGDHSDMLKGIKLAPSPAPGPHPTEPKPSVWDGTEEHKQAYGAAHQWLTDQGLSHEKIEKIHSEAAKYHDAGGDWPKSYVYATGDQAASDLHNQHAQISGPIEKALGYEPPEQPMFGGNDPFDGLAVGDHFTSSGGTWEKTGPESAKLISKTDPNQMASEGEDVNFGWKGANVNAIPKPEPVETSPFAPKFKVGDTVGYVTANKNGQVMGKIVKDVSPSTTQHAYLMDNGDTVHEDSIGGKVAGLPEPKPTGPPLMADMPIKPYLWHKGGGGQTYPSLSTVKPGAHFKDKDGNQYIVVSNVGGVTMAQPIVGGVPGTAIAIPQTFVNKKGKVQPAHVNVL